MKRHNTQGRSGAGYERRSIALRHYPSRRHYLRALVARLQHVPQILPITYRASARTRADHSRNIARMVSAVSFDERAMQTKRHLMLSAMLHDIGHGLHGHASEHAIKQMFGCSAYSNDRQSARLMYFKSDDCEECAPVFGTSGIEPLHDISSASEALPEQGYGPKSRMLDFLDDLENAVGDSGDLLRNGLSDRRELGDTLGLPATFAVEETPMVAVDLLRRSGFDGSYEALTSLAKPNSELSRLLSVARTQIDRCRGQIAEINFADATARAETREMCFEVSTLNPHRPSDWVIDVVSTVDLPDE